jgi:prophage regulatory protein
MLTEKQVLKLIPVARATIQNWVKAETFPKPVPIGPHRVAWFADEIADWQKARSEGRERAAAV